MKEQVVILPKKDWLSMKPKSEAELWERFDEVMKQIGKRAFQLFEERGRENGHDREDWFKAEAELLTPVPIKIADEHNELHIRAEVPGFKADEMAFNLEKSLLTIYGTAKVYIEKQAGQDKCTESETRMICRKVTLPAEVVPEKAEATLKNGILKIVVPKLVATSTKANAATAA